MDAKAAKRARTTLRRKRATKTYRRPCNRCGGEGGSRAWAYTGYTCFRCGGHSSMTFELVTERYYETTEDAMADQGLTEIIDAEARRLQALKQAELDEHQKRKDHEQALRDDAWRDERMAQPFIGTVGERLDFLGPVIYEREVFTQFGTSMLILIKDEATGGVVKTFGSGTTLWGLHKGDVVKGKGTVKAHETYNGSKSTTLKRVKITDRIEQEID